QRPSARQRLLWRKQWPRPRGGTVAPRRPGQRLWFLSRPGCRLRLGGGTAEPQAASAADPTPPLVSPHSPRREGLPDGVPQLVHAERLADQADGSGAQHLRGRLGLGKAGTQQHGYVGPALTKALEGLEGVLAGHHQVENDQIDGSAIR